VPGPGKPENLKPFAKGPDPRRWTKGRPNSFDALSELTRAIAHEVATKKGGEKVEIDGHLVTITEAVLRQWLQSGEFQKQKAALEIAYGKVPDRVDLGSSPDKPLKLIVEYVNRRAESDPTDTPQASS
jgi:hypothetical protein